MVICRWRYSWRCDGGSANPMLECWNMGILSSSLTCPLTKGPFPALSCLPLLRSSKLDYSMHGKSDYQRVVDLVVWCRWRRGEVEDSFQWTERRASGRRTEVEEVSLLGPDGPGDDGGETVSIRGAALLGAWRTTADAAASAALLAALALVATADEAVRSTGGTYSENIWRYD